MNTIDLCGDDTSESEVVEVDSSPHNRPAKRQKQEPSLTHVSDTAPAPNSTSNVSDTTNASTVATDPAAAEAESPTLSPEQVCARMRTACARRMHRFEGAAPCSKEWKT